MQKIDNKLIFQKSDGKIKLPMNPTEKLNILLIEMLGADVDIIHKLSQKRFICYITKYPTFNHFYIDEKMKINAKPLHSSMIPLNSILNYSGNQIFYLFSITGNFVRGAFVDDDGMLAEIRNSLIDEIIL